MDNTIITTQDTLKEHMDALFTFASKASYAPDQPLPIIQASKSLIGMNIDNPPRNLLKWLEQYIKNFQPTYTIPENKMDDSVDDVLTTYELESLIKGRKSKDSKVYLMRILQVADPRHIMELFLEISLEHSLDAILFCWLAYKSIKHMNIEDNKRLLFITLDCLLCNKEQICNKMNDCASFNFLCHSLQMQQTPMVRSHKIYSSILYQSGKIEYTELLLSESYDDLFVLLQEKGDKGLIEYVSALSINDIFAKKILLLDAVRSALRYGQDVDVAIKIIKGKI